MATLAVGFYEATSTSLRISNNDQYSASAQQAAESGMAFIRYELAQLDVPHNTSQDQVPTVVYQQLGSQLNNTANLGADTVGLDGSGNINIPSNTSHTISLYGSSAKFKTTISFSGATMHVKVTGYCSNNQVVRALQMDYAIAQRASAVFSYGVASRSPITMTGNTVIAGTNNPANGSVLSTTTKTNTPLIMSGSDSISGDVSFVNPNATLSGVISSTSSIAGSRNPAVYANHVHTGVDNPEFPTIDTTQYAPYATTAYVSGKTLTNNYLPSGSYSFAGGTVINGVLYVKTPCSLTFTGNTTINGCIVVENNPQGTYATNTIDFKGNVSIGAYPSSMPSGLKSLTGAALLAPNFTVKFGGNFGTIGGSIIGSQVIFYGNAGGTVVGSVINLEDTSMQLSGNSDIYINSSGTSAYPAGVYFGSNFAPLPDTYAEVAP
jgi:hypothetical protein